jgi:hypothetical protein
MHRHRCRRRCRAYGRRHDWRRDHARRRCRVGLDRSWNDQTRGRLCHDWWCRKRYARFHRRWRNHGPSGRCRNRAFLRRWRSHDRAHRSRRRSFLLLSDGFQHVSWPGDVRQVDLGLDSLFAVAGTAGGFRAGGLAFSGCAHVHSHLLRFEVFQRTGVRFLLRYSYQRKCVENSFALYFQLSG